MPVHPDHPGVDVRPCVLPDGTAGETFSIRWTEPTGGKPRRTFDSLDDALDFQAKRRSDKRWRPEDLGPITDEETRTHVTRLLGEKDGEQRRTSRVSSAALQQLEGDRGLLVTGAQLPALVTLRPHWRSRAVPATGRRA